MGLSTILRQIASSSSWTSGPTVCRPGILMRSERNFCNSAILFTTTTTIPLDNKKKKNTNNLCCYGIRGFCSDLSSSIAISNQSIDSKSHLLEEDDDNSQEKRPFKISDEIQEGFPFDIYDVPGNKILLERKYLDEVVKVEVPLPDFTGKALKPLLQIPKLKLHIPNVCVTKYFDHGDSDIDEDSVPAKPSYPLTLIVNVSKEGNVNCLEFYCTVKPDVVFLDRVTVKGPDEDGYVGPYIQDVDENLYNRFIEYLEVRGITPSISKLLYQCLVTKHLDQRSRCLEGITTFFNSYNT